GSPVPDSNAVAAVDAASFTTRQFEEFARLPTVDLTEFCTWLGRVGRVNGPALLFDAWHRAQIDTATLTATIGSVWSDAEYPDQCLDREAWRELFAAAGFTVDGQPATRPAEPVELWRGTVPERRTDWSWTTDRAVAERFAGGLRGRKPGRLYRLLAPPHALLCANTERDEAEYVVDTTGLAITEGAEQ
ncbi:hypothetical protein, partial [Streptomyces griseoluteus]|uniref:hypothetical protein n=1 Tax=Streptomyces griseoluteus TaxID=29306 RepID=UPI00331847B2